MSFTFIHTADWQIGKPFGEFDGDKPGVLRQYRLTAIDRIAAAARERGAGHVLAAGDIFDFETGAPKLVQQVLQRLAGHRDLTWHLISGNHDPARAASVWEEAQRSAPPANVILHLSAEPREIAPGIVLLPAPLHAKSSVSDPTAWMDHTATPTGTMRIGLAHGSVTGFGSEGEASVPIDPARPRLANLDFLALGDWHGTKKISDRVWYAGTPEPDGFRDNEPGHVLAVTIPAQGAVPQVEKIRTAHFTWMKRDLRLSRQDDLDALVSEINHLGPDAQRHLLQLTLSGRVALADRLALGDRLAAIEVALYHFAADLSQLSMADASASLETFGHGAVRAVAERLTALAASQDPQQAHLAAQALVKLAMIAQPPNGEVPA